MGRQKLGAYIRKIDYLKAKKDEDYDDEDSPSTKLRDFFSDCADAEDITFDELKDAFAAFESKVCVKNFPELDSGPFWVARTTLDELASLMSDFIDENEGKKNNACEVYLQSFKALISAGPNTAHVILMELLTDASPSIEDYIQSQFKKTLGDLLSALKITPKYTRNEACDEQTYGCYIQERMSTICGWLSEQQCKMVQNEFLDVYHHYHTLMLSLSPTLNEHMTNLIKIMPENFEDENPYFGLKDSSVFKKHITAVKDLVCSKGYGSGTPKDQTAERTLKRIMKALKQDKALLAEVCGHFISTIDEVAKTPGVTKAGKEVFEDYRSELRKETGDKEKPPSSPVGKKTEQPKAGNKTSKTKNKDNSLDGIASKATDNKSPGGVNNILKKIIKSLQSGMKEQVEQAEGIIRDLKDSKALDWKSHVDEAKSIMKTIGDITDDQMQDDDDEDLDDTASQYIDFSKTFLEQLKKNKVVPQLQPALLEFFFKCMSISTPLKTEISEWMSDEGFLDFSKDKSDRLAVLKKCESMLKDKSLPWSNIDFAGAVNNVLRFAVKAFDGNGRNVTPEENKLFISIFKICGAGNSVDHFYKEDDEEIMTLYGAIYQTTLMDYVQLHQGTSTTECVAPIIPDVLKWAKLALTANHEDLSSVTFAILSWIGMSAPASIKTSLPEIMDLMLTSNKAGEIYSLVKELYPHNPKPVHDKLPKMFDKLDRVKDTQRHIYTTLFQMVSQAHAEVFKANMIEKLLQLYDKTSTAEKPLILLIMKNIADKNPSVLVDFLPQLCDDVKFNPDSMNLRSSIIAGIGGLNETKGQQAVDYLMKFANHSDPSVSQITVGTVSTIARDHIEYMQQYKAVLENLEKTSTIPQVRDMAHDMILLLEGKTVENIAEGLQEQQEDIADLDVKVDATIGTVITMGEKVVEHDKEIGQLEEGLEHVEERVDDVEEDLGDAKIKMEEIDNKTMTNAPKWSRDLTKLMNPTTDNDWRLLASRLGYTNDDIRGWATQHDPCMALLSEWYATHKTSEASFGVLTALVEMNRMDGAAIVENAMKQAEGVVEDEEFEYASPPPVFISYQWGVQNEVKLLKQHLNMAGFECWMDVGQMGGGDKLFAKIDNGIRGAKIVICCVTEKYAQSPNCNREVNLSVNLNKPIIPLLMDKMDWPPKGSMGPIFSEYLFIRFFQRGGEETPEKDQRYWPLPKFQELLMQLNFFVVPDQKMVKKEYAHWWAPIAEDIVIDKNKSKKQTSSQKPQQKDTQVVKADESPLVFLSYQWGKQPQIKALYKRLTSMGYSVWMDIYQMGGGDSLYDKIDRGMRGCKAVVSCVTQKYSLSANCRREISLADALKKPIIPLLLEQMKWPPDGPMSMVFTELLYINCYRDEVVQIKWTGDGYEELAGKLAQYVPLIEAQANTHSKARAPAVTPGKSKTTNSKSNNSKAAPSFASKTAGNTKAVPGSSTQSMNNKSIAASNSTPKPVASVSSPKPAATRNTSESSNQAVPTKKEQTGTTETKVKASTNQQAVQPKQQIAENGTAQAQPQPGKSKSCVIL